MDATVDAIGHKADVPARVREGIGQRIETVKETLGDAAEHSKVSARTAQAAANDLIDDSRERLSGAARSTRRTASIVLENPLGLVVGALAVGFIGGLFVPVSSFERKRIQPLGDEIAGRAQAAAAEAFDAGKSILNETLATAATSAQQHGKEIAQHAVAGTPLETSSEQR